MHVVRRGLEVPRHLAGVDVDRDQRAREEVVPLAAALREGRRRIAGAEDVELGLRIVDARQPRLRAAVTGGVEAGPGVEARIAFLHRDGVELPLQLAGFGIERLQEAGRVEVVAGPGDDVVAGDDRRHRREVLLVERGDFLVPALLAGFRFEGDEVVVRRLHVEVVLPHPEAAVRDVGAASRFPEVVPELAAVAGVERPGVVRRGHIQRVVDEQRRAFDRSVGRDRKVSLAFAADDHAAAAAAAAAEAPRRTVDQPDRPRQGERLHRRLIDLLERAVPLAGVVAGVGRPLIAERFEQIGGVEAAALRREHGGRRAPTAAMKAVAWQSFQRHQIGSRVVDVFLGAAPLISALCPAMRILNLDFRRVAVAPEAAQGAVVEGQGHDEVIDPDQPAVDLLRRRA